MASLSFTTSALVKSRLNETGSKWDTIIASLILEVSDDLEKRMGREVKQEARTEYYDGSGTDTLILRQGPLVSVTSVHSIDYSDAGDNSRTETATEVYEYERLEGGLASEGHIGLAWIQLDWSTFTRGKRNYKVIYTAGLSADQASLPATLIRAATNYTVMLFNQRQSMGLMNLAVGGSESDPIPLKNLDEAVARSIEPFRVYGLA